MRPLLALEQPDLIVTLPDGTGLLSIEITEQQEFGLNAQQRMARFWSAVACNVPSAYLLPLESYQIEEASGALSSILSEADPNRRNVLLLGAVLPEIRGSVLFDAGVRSLEELTSAINSGTKAFPEKTKRRVADFLLRHVERDGPVRHIPAVPPEEHLHIIDDTTYKVYLRPTGMPTAMLLDWMANCSRRVPTYPFKMQSEQRHLFRTNGVVHTMDDPENPHLSFRNLPPGPLKTEVVSSKAGKDEISLFFEFVEAAVNRGEPPDLDREMFTRQDEFFRSADKNHWRHPKASATEVIALTSGDYHVSKSELSDALGQLSEASNKEWSSEVSKMISAVAKSYHDFHTYKIKCTAQRSLADPYSGALAVRDVLFCRTDLSKDLSAFKRSSGLVFMVDLTGDAAVKHPFLYKALDRQYRSHIRGGKTSDPQMKLLELARSTRIELLPKDLRCHLLFSDIILVRRSNGSSTEVEAIVGIPGLMHLGVLNESCAAVRSLTK